MKILMNVKRYILVVFILSLINFAVFFDTVFLYYHFNNTVENRVAEHRVKDILNVMNHNKSGILKTIFKYDLDELDRSKLTHLQIVLCQALDSVDIIAANIYEQDGTLLLEIKHSDEYKLYNNKDNLNDHFENVDHFVKQIDNKYVSVLVPLFDKEKHTAVYMEVVFKKLVFLDYAHNVLIVLFLFSVIVMILIFFIFYTYDKELKELIINQRKTNVELLTVKDNLEANSIEKSRFLANISHEFRTPLNTILGFIEIMKEECEKKLDKKYVSYADDIVSSANHLLGLINDIIDLSKANINKLDINIEKIDVVKVLQNSIKMLVHKAEKESKTIKFDSSEESIEMYADAKRLRQVIINILSNAVKFIDPGGEICLSVSSNDGYIIIKCSDDGIGIAEHNIVKILSDFGQVDNNNARNYEGAGLGIPLSKKLTEMMNGTFEINSKLNVGTTVILTFTQNCDMS